MSKTIRIDASVKFDKISGVTHRTPDYARPIDGFAGPIAAVGHALDGEHTVQWGAAEYEGVWFPVRWQGFLPRGRRAARPTVAFRRKTGCKTLTEALEIAARRTLGMQSISCDEVSYSGFDEE